jgi:hypothetical protein
MNKLFDVIFLVIKHLFETLQNSIFHGKLFSSASCIETSAFAVSATIIALDAWELSSVS